MGEEVVSVIVPIYRAEYKTNTLSFIVPVYNVEEYLEMCLQSLQNQTINDFEVILINDGSTDRSGLICEKYAQDDCRFKIIYQENMGLAAARNTGQKVASGKWISFVDSDDWIETTYIEKLLPYMDQDYELIFFQYDEIYRNHRKPYRSTDKKYILSPKDFKMLEQDSIDTGIGNRISFLKPYRAQAWTKIYRKDFLDKNSLSANPKLRRSQDVMFNLEVYNYASKGILIPEVLYHYRMVESSLSHQYNKYQISRLTCLMEEMGKYLESSQKMQEYQMLYNKRIVLTLVNFCLLDYCHPKNPQKYCQRRKMFLEKRKDIPFYSVYSKARIKDYGFLKGIFVLCVKYRLFFILNILTYLKNIKG